MYAESSRKVKRDCLVWNKGNQPLLFVLKLSVKITFLSNYFGHI